MEQRILIVDDDANIRRLVTMALSDDSPYIVHAVSSGEAALLHITRQPVDLLFTDLKMPGMDGIELVQRVRELDLNMAVIVFTVSPEELSAERAKALKIDCLLEKPLAPEQLRLAVDLLLDPRKLLPRARAPHVEPELTQKATTKPLAANTRALSGPLNQRLAQHQARRQTTPLANESAPVAMRLTSTSHGGRGYSEAQIEAMRLALKDLALEPDVQCALLADMSGIVLTHWSRRRDINVTVVAALAAGNSLALTEIGRNLGQQRPSNLVIQEGFDQSIIMAHINDLLLLLAIGANASLGWARIATLRACEDITRIAAGDSKV
jgi:CheY-like chemotaxis protein